MSIKNATQKNYIQNDLLTIFLMYRKKGQKKMHPLLEELSLDDKLMGDSPDCFWYHPNLFK